jgi:ribokinase
MSGPSVPSIGRVIVVGSIGVDFTVVVQRLPRPGETVAGGTFVPAGGAKSANQAVAAARVGAQVHLLGAVGGDDVGVSVLDELRQENIDVSAVRHVPGMATAVALIMVDRNGENQIAVASGANLALGRNDVAEALSAMALDADDVVLVGFEIGDEPVEAACAAAASAGATLIINPAPARPLSERMLAARPILTPNEGEATVLAQRPGVAVAARELHARSGAPVLVTLGEKGAWLLDEHGQAHELPAFKVDVLDTTGAGDTFNGILAAGLAAGLPLTEAARQAVVGATLSVRGMAARGGMPTRAELDEHFAEAAGPERLRTER